MVSVREGPGQVRFLLQPRCVGLRAWDAGRHRDGTDSGDLRQDVFDARVFAAVQSHEGGREHVGRYRLCHVNLRNDRQRLRWKPDEGKGQVRRGVEEASRQAVEGGGGYFQRGYGAAGVAAACSCDRQGTHLG